jgi:two-component system, LytTR family, response regulator LytT
MKVKCLIVEDEPIAQEILKSYIDKTDFLEVAGQLTNAIDAFSFLQNQKVNLLFLDIKMPQMSGMELLRSLTTKPRVVITSAYRYYATDAFELDVVDYLLKPYSFERFLKAVSKAMSIDIKTGIAEKITEKPFIFIKGNKQLHKIVTEDILFIESQRDYLKFHMRDHADVVTRQTIGYYEEFLPAHMFLRVHRSFIVAVDKIRLVEATRIFVGSTPIPIGRNYKVRVHDSLKGISA